MYDYEITNFLQSRNYEIDSESYLRICFSSPQLDHIKFDPYDCSYEVWSKDGAYWKFKVYKKE